MLVANQHTASASDIHESMFIRCVSKGHRAENVLGRAGNVLANHHYIASEKQRSVSKSGLNDVKIRL